MIEQVIDASVIIRGLVKGEPFGNKARKMIREARAKRVMWFGPPILEYEVESEFQRRIYRRELNSIVVDNLLNEFYGLGIQIEKDTDVVRRAREIARQYRQERIYDALYVALAELRGCELWTADRALYEGVRSGLPFVNYLADYS